MKKLLKLLILIGLLSGPLWAQQPQTSTAPTYATNSKWVQGVGPGYWPTKGGGFVLHLSAGSIVCNGSTPISYAGGNLTLASNTTSYIQLDATNSCAPLIGLAGFLAGNSPVAIVTTNGSQITSIVDWRPIGVGFAAGNSSLFTSFQLGSNSPITGNSKYFQLTAGPNVTIGSMTGAGSSGNPFIVQLSAAGGGGTPNVNTPVCWATTSALGGDDSNSGLSNVLPKADIYSCIQNFVSSGANGGTIYIYSKSSAAVNACPVGLTTGCGIWLAYSVSYPSPPTGFITISSNGSFQFIGVGGANTFFNKGPQVSVNAGDSTPGHPSIWIAGLNSGMVFKNLAFTSCSPARIGFSPTGSTSDGNATAWNKLFDNVSFRTIDSSGCGPALQVENGSSQIEIDHSQLINNGTANSAFITNYSRTSNVTTVTTTAAIPTSWTTTVANIGIVGSSDPSFNVANVTITVVDTTHFTYPNVGPNATATGFGAQNGAASSSLGQVLVVNQGGGFGSSITMNDDLFYGGGARMFAASQLNSLEVSNSFQEAGFSPAVWAFSGTVNNFLNVNNFVVDDIQTQLPAVRIEAGNSASACQALAVDKVEGPCTLLGGSTNLLTTKNPLLSKQFGLFGNSRLVGQTDISRRGFGPVAAVQTNLTTQNNSPLHTGVTLTQNVTGPDNVTNNAWSATTANAFSSNVYFNLVSEPVAPGYWFGCGAWFQPINTGFLSNNPISVGITSISNTVDLTLASDPTNTSPNNEWGWYWQAIRVGTGSGTGTLGCNFSVTSTHGANYYAPVLIAFPSTIDDNDVAETMNALQTYPSDCVPGQVCGLHGQQLAYDSVATVYVGEPWVVGGGGVTANSLVQTDGSNPSKIVASTTGVYGIASTTASANATIEVARYGTIPCTTDTGGATVGDLAIIGTSTVSFCKDSGQTSSSAIATTARIVGVFRSTATAGNTALVELTPAHFGTNINSPLTTEGDLYYYHSAANARLAIGTVGQCLISNGTDPLWGACSGTTGMVNPMTTVGDIIYGGSSGTPTRLGIGSTNQVLGVNAGIPAWLSPRSAGSTGQLQVANSNALSGITLGGDCTFATPNITCTKSGGVVFSTGAFANISLYALLASPTFSGTLTAPTIVASTQFSGPGTGLSGTAASLNIGGTATKATQLASAPSTCGVVGGAQQFPNGITVAGNPVSCITPSTQIPNISISVPTGTYAANACSVAPITASMPGVYVGPPGAAFGFSPSADANVAGTGFASTGPILYFDPWASLNTLNYKICNNNSSPIVVTVGTTWFVFAK